MKKKLIPLLLAVLLLLTACSPGNSERGKELGYFNYPGLEWGMSETEFLKAAGASENDFTVETDDVALSKKYTLENTEFLGKNADEISWLFIKNSEDDSFFLYSVTAEYSGEIEANERIEKLNSLAKTQEVSVNATTERVRFEGDQSKNVFDDEALYAEGADVVWLKYKMESDATVADLPEDLYEKAKAGYSELSPVDDFDSYGAFPLSSASVWYIRDMKAEEATLTLTFTGEIAKLDALAE